MSTTTPGRTMAAGAGATTVGAARGGAMWVLRRFWLVGLLFLLWWFVTRMGWVADYKLPAPGTVWDEFVRAVRERDLVGSVLSTLQRLVQGWAIGVIVAVLLGVSTSAVPFLEDGIRPLMAGLQAVPTIAFLPLAILWFGFGESAVLAITIFGTFKPMVLATYGAVHQVSPTLRMAGRAMGARGLFFQRTLVFPACIPQLVTGLRLSWAFAWRSLMAAELIVGGTPGLGQLLEEGRELNDIELVIAVIIVIAAIGIVVEQVVFTRFERWVRRRWGLAGPS